MTYIVHGATGAQGSPVLAALLAAGHPAIAAVRDPAVVAGSAVAVDYTSVDSLTSAYSGADGVFVHLPLATPVDQMAHAHAIGEAVRRASPARVVLSTSGYPVGTADKADTALGVLVGELSRSGVSYAVVEPRVFLDNLLLPITVEPARENGVLGYPVRDDYAISWISHLDVAEVVVRLLTDTSIGGAVSVGALPGLVGKDLAEAFGKYFDRDVQFDALTPDAYGSLIGPMFGADATAPVVESYRARLTQPGDVIDENNSAQNILGLAPRSVEQWLRDVLH